MISYKDTRSQIKDGDIVFIANKKGLVASAIRLFTRSIYSHVNIAFWIETEAGPRLMAVEAQGGTTRRIINLSFYESQCEMHVVSPPKEWKTVVAPSALIKLGFQKYSYSEAFYVGLREFLLKYLGIKIKEQKLGEICSEFVARVNLLTDEQISPQMLMQELNKLGSPIKFMIARTK